MWIVIKVVVNTGAPPIIGVAVGPFETHQDAEDYITGAVVGALGYENWIVKELEEPKF